MAKRPRGKTAQKLAQRAKVRNTTDSALGSSSWSTLEEVQSDEEQEYETRPRKFQIQDEQVEKLPVKTLQGEVKRVIKSEKRKVREEPEESEESESESESESAEDESKESNKLSESAHDESDVEIDDVSLNNLLIELKEEIADIAEKLNEDPEEHIGKLRDLRELLNSAKHIKAKQLLILSLVAIFKSLIPGYRIRPLTETEQKEKVTKEVKKLRNFEETLLLNYREYISSLQAFSKKAKGSPQGSYRALLGASSLFAACELLESVSYFNFRNELIQIVVDKASTKKVDEPYYRAVQTLETIFKSDEEGQVSFDLVRLLSKMIKARKYKVNEMIINSLLHLRLLTELIARADLERVQKSIGDDTLKVNKKDRVHLTKKERKARKERKSINEEMMRAETAVSAEERERLQGQTLKLVFILYFNILKERSEKLIGVTLEGLAKFAHLINADLFGDLLEVLRELILERQKRIVDGEYEFKESATRESLLCIITAFTLLSGQSDVGESMNLDLSFFINHFYSSLYSLSLNADLEFSHKTLRLDDPLKTANTTIIPSKYKVNVSTETEMMIRAFEFIFFRQRNIGSNRVLSFAKRLAISSLHMPEKSCLASLRILDKMTKKFSSMPALYSTEDRVANGIYNMEVDEPEHSNPEASTIWETVLLEKHYSPMVAKAAKAVPKSAIVRT